MDEEYSSSERMFINYRRNDTRSAAISLVRLLRHNLGNSSCFLDTEIPPGTGWKDELREEIKKCKIFLALIGPNWVIERLNRENLSEEDWVCKEIVLALKSRTKKVVVPVLIGDAEPIATEDLPSELKGLFDKQWHRIRLQEHFDKDVQKLISSLEIKHKTWELPFKWQSPGTSIGEAAMVEPDYRAQIIRVTDRLGHIDQLKWDLPLLSSEQRTLVLELAQEKPGRWIRLHEKMNGLITNFNLLLDLVSKMSPATPLCEVELSEKILKAIDQEKISNCQECLTTIVHSLKEFVELLSELPDEIKETSLIGQLLKLELCATGIHKLLTFLEYEPNRYADLLTVLVRMHCWLVQGRRDADPLQALFQ